MVIVVGQIDNFWLVAKVIRKPNRKNVAQARNILAIR